MRKYKIKCDRVLGSDKTPVAKQGDIVYGCTMPDYGLAKDDTRMTGIYHVSVTHDVNGGYPFFTIPASDLDPV